MLVELRVGEQRYRAVWEAGYGRERSLEDTPPSSPREDGSPFCGRCWIRTNLVGFWLGAILRKLRLTRQITAQRYSLLPASFQRVTACRRPGS
jgi:hypothetical protein